MVTVQHEDYVAIERCIQRYRLQGLLEIIAYICGQIAKQVVQRWNDPRLAQTWESDAAAVNQTRDQVAN